MDEERGVISMKYEKLTLFLAILFLISLAPTRVHSGSYAESTLNSDIEGYDKAKEHQRADYEFQRMQYKDEINVRLAEYKYQLIKYKLQIAEYEFRKMQENQNKK